MSGPDHPAEGLLRQLLAAPRRPGTPDSAVRWRYHVVPRGGRPRILVHENHWKTAREHLLPSGRWQKLAWRVVTALGALGLANLLFDRCEIETDARAPLRGQHPQSDPCTGVSFLLGTPGPEQKAVAQVTSEGDLWYVKIGQSPTAQRLIANECELLSRLPTHLEPLGPRVLGYWEDSGARFLAVSRVRGRHGGTRFLQLHSEFCDELRSGASVLARNTDLYGRVQRAAAESSELSEIWAPLDSSIGESRFEGAVVHGDFTPWNARVTPGGKRLAAIDWEHGVLDGIAGVDALHFGINTAMLLERPTMLDRRLERWLSPGSACYPFVATDSTDYRLSLILLTLAYDVATGVWASGGRVTELNERKLLLMSKLSGRL